jgi:hypothetical protein
VTLSWTQRLAAIVVTTWLRKHWTELLVVEAVGVVRQPRYAVG